MSDQPHCVFYSLAFGKPKPMHRFIFENWSHFDFAEFRVFTDEGALWREKLNGGKKNIEIIDISLQNWFATFFDDYQVSSHEELLEKHNDVFGPGLSGWNACCMRPLSQTVFGKGENPPVWGWLDYDVLLNAKALKAYVLNNPDKQLLLFPRHGAVWEHCKLYRASVDVTGLTREVAQNPRKERTPIDVVVPYRIREMHYTYDDLPQNQIAAHWKYADLRPGSFLENKFDVIIDDKMRLTDPAGREILVFIADTEVKQFNEEETEVVESVLRMGERYRFVHHPVTE